MKLLETLNKVIEDELIEKSDVIINKMVNDFNDILIYERDKLIPEIMKTLEIAYRDNMVADSLEIIIKKEVQ